MYVVTGATGNTGHIVAKNLLANGQKVRAIGRTTDRLQSIVAEGAEPFVADLTNKQALSKAFSGARAVYAMIPPNLSSENYRAYQDRVSDAITSALAAAKVQYSVTLSSVGADKPSKTGPVVGLHNLEQQLNKIEGLNVLHLRPGYFMENTLVQVGVIQAMGIAAGPLRSDLKLPIDCHTRYWRRSCRRTLEAGLSTEADARTAGSARSHHDRSRRHHRQSDRQTRSSLQTAPG